MPKCPKCGYEWGSDIPVVPQGQELPESQKDEDIAVLGDGRVMRISTGEDVTNQFKGKEDLKVPKERRNWWERFRNAPLTPLEQEEKRARFEAMSPEEKAQWRDLVEAFEPGVGGTTVGERIMDNPWVQDWYRKEEERQRRWSEWRRYLKKEGKDFEELPYKEYERMFYGKPVKRKEK